MRWLRNIQRRRVAEVLDHSHTSDRVGVWVDITLVSLILINVLAIVLESVHQLNMAYGSLFRAIEHVSVAIFSVEYGLRLWSCVDRPAAGSGSPLRQRLRYMRSPTALIDLIAIAPYYLTLFFPYDLLFLRVIRLMRVFKLTRYSAATSILLEVLQEEARSFAAAFFVLFILLVIASSGIYMIERDIQPEAFGSIPAAMWWAMATLTTVGYGDVTPASPLGKIFGGFITVIGMGMVALPAGILASGFAENLNRRRMQFGAAVELAADDGVISDDERRELELLRKAVALSAEDAELLELSKLQTGNQLCPHCGKALHASPHKG